MAYDADLRLMAVRRPDGTVVLLDWDELLAADDPGQHEAPRRSPEATTGELELRVKKSPAQSSMRSARSTPRAQSHASASATVRQTAMRVPCQRMWNPLGVASIRQMWSELRKGIRRG